MLESIDPAVIKEIATYVGGAAAAVYIGWKARMSEKKADGAEKKATEAKDLAEPTGNGFARRVLSDLGEIKADGKRTAEKLDRHIEAHANGAIRPAA